MIIWEVDRERYLENPVRIPLVHLETLDGHRTSQVLPITYICKPTIVVNSPHAYESLLKDIRAGYDATGLTNLGEKPQTPLSVFFIKAVGLHKNLC